ncbi:MAG: hypothetical protein LBF68_08380 [Christensenellaceae bacterium]|nr:hypothetical protein [Christensenellaceae bacterium]
MRKSVFQLVIIAILLIGMVGIIVAVKTSITLENNGDYYPTTSDTGDKHDNDISLEGYQLVEFQEHSFPVLDDLKYAFTYFDADLSFKNFFVDDQTVQVGDKVAIGTVLGTLDQVAVLSDCIGIVVTVTNSAITVKVITDIFAKFSYNIYDYTVYRIGDEFNILKNGVKVSTAKIVSINYYEVIEDCVEVTLLIDNSDLIFSNATYVEFVPCGYAIKTAYAVSSSIININDNSYQVINKTFAYICVKDKQIYNINIEFGISYFGYLEITNVTCDYENFDLSGGKLYAKSAT